jgi:hypothetical protein
MSNLAKVIFANAALTRAELAHQEVRQCEELAAQLANGSLKTDLLSHLAAVQLLVNTWENDQTEWSIHIHAWENDQTKWSRRRARWSQRIRDTWRHHQPEWWTLRSLPPRPEVGQQEVHQRRRGGRSVQWAEEGQASAQAQIAQQPLL